MIESIVTICTTPAEELRITQGASVDAGAEPVFTVEGRVVDECPSQCWFTALAQRLSLTVNGMICRAVEKVLRMGMALARRIVAGVAGGFAQGALCEGIFVLRP